MENRDITLADKSLDIRFFAPDGLTKERIRETENEIQIAMEEYGEEHNGDYGDVD